MAAKKWLTIAEYAKHSGYAQRYVQELIKEKGKISPLSTKMLKGRLKINREKADEDLKNNVSARHRRKDYVPKNADEAQPIPEDKKEPDTTKLVSLAEAQKLKANYDAELKRLELEEKQGFLLKREDVERAEADLILSARSKILSIKGSLAPLLKEFIQDAGNFGIAMESVENIIRETLKEMADGGVRRKGH